MNPIEFLAEFQAEAAEKLDAIGGYLLRLERDTSNLEPVRDMFLAAHTIKGGAAMLRLTDVEALAHALEDLLSSLRDRRQTLGAPIADLLFQTTDYLRSLIVSASVSAVGAEPDPRVQEWAARLRASAATPPSLQATAASPGLAPQPTSHTELRPPRVLLVDASATVRELYRLLLSDSGFEVEAVEDGQAALARALAGSFDLVVSGLETPGLRGFDLASALRSAPGYRDVPIVLVSSDDDADRRRLAVRAGAQVLLPKGSLDDQRLLDAVRGLLAPRAA